MTYKKDLEETTTQSLTENFGRMAELAEGDKNGRQLLILNKFEHLWKVDQKTKVVYYFDNSN